MLQAEIFCAGRQGGYRNVSFPANFLHLSVFLVKGTFGLYHGHPQDQWSNGDQGCGAGPLHRLLGPQCGAGQLFIIISLPASAGNGQEGVNEDMSVLDLLSQKELQAYACTPDIYDDLYEDEDVDSASDSGDEDMCECDGDTVGDDWVFVDNDLQLAQS